MEDRNEMTRRQVLGNAGIAMAAGATAPLAGMLEHPMMKPGQVSANDKLRVALLGCGGMGSGVMKNLMNFPDVQIVGLCDVDESRMPGDIKAVEDKYGRRPHIAKDYRTLLDRKDVDAVIIATPDHWHALNLIHAVEAGKDCFLEKPISHNLVEAVAMAEAARRHKRVVQVNTWQRGTKEFTDAIDYVRSGKLGKVVLCRAWITDGFRAGRQTPVDVPKSLDYDMWTGPAKMIPYKPNHVHFNWRWFMNYGGGMTTDWGVHMMDIALLGMSKDQNLRMPVSVAAYGGQYAITDDDRTAPDTTEAIYQFKDPDFVLHWAVKRDHPGLPGHGTEFVSAEGKTLRVWRGGWKIMDADGKELPKEEPTQWQDHSRDFVDRVKDRGKPRADISSVAQTTIVCHLANVAMLSGETIRWDNQRQDIVGKAGRDTIAYQREYRKPYKLPVYRPTR